MTPKTMTLLFAVLLVTALLPTTIFAAPDPGEGGDQAEHAARKEQMRGRIRMMRMYALTEALDLDEATAARLFPFRREGDGAREALHEQKRQRRQALRRLMKADGDPSQEAVSAQLDGLAQLEIEAARLRAEQVKGLSKILSPRQQVKFMIVNEKLESEVRRMIHETKRERRRGRFGGGDDGPDGPSRRERR